MVKTKKKKMAGMAKNLIVDKTTKASKKKEKIKRNKKQDKGQGQDQIQDDKELDERQEELMASMLDEDDDHYDIEQGNADDNGEPNEEDEGRYGNFMKDLAAIEGAPRFLHYNDDRDVDVAFAEALNKSDKANANSEDVDDHVPAPSVPIDSFLSDLPATKSGAAIKKALKKSTLTEQELEESRKKQKKKDRNKRKREGEELDQEQDEGSSKSLRLPMPLSAPQQERVARSALYERSKEDVKVWDAVVHSSRAAETKKFPLVKPDLRMATNKASNRAFKPRNELEEQVMSLLRKSNKVEESSRLSDKEEALLAQMTIREAEEKRQEMVRLKLLQQYQEAKLKRQNKIKSRKYRKIARKQKEKEREKEIEELKKTDPELALEKMQEDEKSRILERATLKHRNNSKFMQLQAKRARKDKESQNQYHQGLTLHRTLTSKRQDDESQKDDYDVDNQEDIVEGDEEEEQSVQAFNANLKQFWKQQEQAREQAEELKRLKERERLEMASNSIDDLFTEAGRVMQRKLDKDRDDSDKDDEEAENDEDESLAMKTDENGKMDEEKEAKEIRDKKKKKEKAILDPDKFIQTVDLAKKNLMKEVTGDSDDEEEDFQSQAQAISEAFAGDDVTTEFKSEKQAEIDKSRPKDIDLTLPGWGSWGGEGIQISKRKRKRFTIKAPPPPKRRDENRGHLILNDKEDEKLRKHQVTNVPFPFTTVADFEASIRTPIGDAFVPRTAFKKLIKPKVETKMGAMIDPMDESELVKRKIK